MKSWISLSDKEKSKFIAENVLGWSIYNYDKDVPERCYSMLMDENFDPVANDVPWSWRNGERETEELAWDDCPDLTANTDLVMKAQDIYLKMQSE